MNENKPATSVPIQQNSELGAVVLCGGQSERMGLDKSQLVFQGQTLLERVVDRVSEVASAVVVAGGENLKHIETPKRITRVSDESSEVGPLEGIRLGLTALAASKKFAFVSGCDVPLLEPRIISHLFSLIGDHQCVIPVSDERVFGMTAIYRTDIADQIQELIGQKKLRVQDLAEHFNTLKVDIESLREFDAELDSFTNINDRDDYFQLLRRFDEEIPSMIAMKMSSKILLDEDEDE
jgi:molybdopterin-guanine dinucleotide biosynthesis protein A